ncbi:MAG: hypothetical protein V2A74_11230 [bacterium]
MSGDEVFVLFFSGLLGLGMWIRWYWMVGRVTALARSGGERFAIQLIPFVCAGILYGVLRKFASADVKDSTAYLSFYMVMGAAWVGFVRGIMTYLGLHVRDDVAERGNAGAMWAISGALVGLTLCFAGANIGNGPGWWVVVFAAALSTGTFYVLWFILERVASISDSVTIDRDAASGFRLAGFLVALGLVLGCSVAGDWVSPEATIRDFYGYAYPVVVLVAVAVGLEPVVRPNQSSPQRSWLLCGLAPTLLYLGMAWMYLDQKGWWA